MDLRQVGTAGRLRRLAFGIAPRETTFARRGFQATSSEAQARLEHIGETFLEGYHAALEAASCETLALQLERIEVERRGFAYEGAAMGLALPARLLPWRRRALEAFLAGPAQPHVYMAHIGIGWALAALPGPIGGTLRRYDGFLRWLIVDGFGFYHAYFQPKRCLREQRVPGRVRGYGRRAFDQGLGRALWFVEGANVPRVAHTLASFDASRRADLWAGVGLAAAYAGGVSETTLLAVLHATSGAERAALQQGACFAAVTRQHAGNPGAHIELACRTLTGLSFAQAAERAARALRDARGHDDGERYENVRRTLQRHFEV
jgi:hypothetical protein